MRQREYCLYHSASAVYKDKVKDIQTDASLQSGHLRTLNSYFNNNDHHGHLDVMFLQTTTTS